MAKYYFRIYSIIKLNNITGLFYRALPEHTYLFKNENAKGCKISKERITILCCASMSGKKQKLLVIGKLKIPVVLNL